MTELGDNSYTSHTSFDPVFISKIGLNAGLRCTCAVGLRCTCAVGILVFPDFVLTSVFLPGAWKASSGSWEGGHPGGTASDYHTGGEVSESVSVIECVSTFMYVELWVSKTSVKTPHLTSAAASSFVWGVTQVEKPCLLSSYIHTHTYIQHNGIYTHTQAFLYH